MTMNMEIHPAYEILKLQALSYEHQTKLILKHTEENDKRIDDLTAIKDMLALINKRRSELVDLKNGKGKVTGKGIAITDPKEKDLIDRVHAIAPYLMPADRYNVEEKGIDGLVESLNNETRAISTMINPEFMKVREKMEERNRIDEIVADMIKLYQEEGKSFVRNQVAR